MTKKRILIIDPERDLADLLARVAESRGNAKCYVATRDEEAESLFRDIPVDLALIDQDRATLHDFRLLHHVKQLFPRAIIVLLSSHISETQPKPATGLVDAVLHKPITTQGFRDWLAEFESQGRARGSSHEVPQESVS